MITLPNGKICMNEQEAIQWLLDNYPIPFQCSANYAPLTEIGLGTIVNPTPSKVKVGSLIFFADSKVSTVVGLTANGFICSDQYNDLVDDIVYVSNVQLNSSGHLIVTLSNDEQIDAGLIKQVTGFSINASQHLIVSYNDGSTTDLGAIFSGNINISGNLTVTGGISGNAITGDSIIENMNGYSAYTGSEAGWNFEKVYVSAVKNGNKLTLVFAYKITKTAADAGNTLAVAGLIVPSSVYSKLYPVNIGGINYLTLQQLKCFSSRNDYKEATTYLTKVGGNEISLFLYYPDFTLNETYYVRVEATFLLSDDLAA